MKKTAAVPAPPLDIYKRLVTRLRRLRFAEPVTHVYNPLEYASRSHNAYLERYGRSQGVVLLLGMNPGPWGMAQTGVPFGEVSAVRDWLGIDMPVATPTREHPKRPVLGFSCPRSEVSGARLWAWARETFGTPRRFFARFFVANYCPLCFMEHSGRNRTPDKLPRHERDPLFAACDEALVALVDRLRPTHVVGVGTFAEARARAALSKTAPEAAVADLRIGRVLHPSPASPAANRGWAQQATAELRALSAL